LFMILFLCANGMAESVRERLWEFGVLKTFGYSDAGLGLLVVLEAAIPTLLAAVLGAALARAVDAFIAHLAMTGVINMPEISASSAAFGWALGVALIVALISSVAPLQRLRRMQVGAVVAGRRAAADRGRDTDRTGQPAQPVWHRHGHRHRHGQRRRRINVDAVSHQWNDAGLLRPG
jgi:predicted lysophospholipase L1 biosynthesis ABC-type transport system permease subunit